MSKYIVFCLFCLGAWSCTDKSTEVTEAKAAQENQQVQQQGQLRDSPSARVESVGDVSFVVPGGWGYTMFDQYRGPLGAKIGLATLFDGPELGLIIVGLPFTATNKKNDFNKAWNAYVNNKAPPPSYGSSDYSSRLGYQGISAYSTSRQDNHYFVLYVLETGTASVPILVETSNQRLYLNLQDVIKKFVDRVRVTPSKAYPPKRSLTMADLVGEWNRSESSAHSRIDRSTGRTSTDSYLFGDTYRISSDGRYSLKSAAALNYKISRSETAGRVEFINDEIVFRETVNKRANGYWFISYETDPNERTMLTLLPAEYNPTESVSPYYKIFVRENRKR